MPLTPNTGRCRSMIDLDQQMRDFAARVPRPRPSLLTTIRAAILAALWRQAVREPATPAPERSQMRWWLVLDNPQFGWPDDVIDEARAARDAEMEALAAELRKLDGR